MADAVGPSDALSEEVLASAEAVADWVLAELARRQGGLEHLPGALGRLPTRDDLRQHVEFLAGALALQEPQYFRDYMAWSHRVLTARGAPPTVAPKVLSAIGAYYKVQLAPERWTQVQTVLDAGHAALGEAASPSPPTPKLFSSALPDVPTFVEHLLAVDATAARRLAEQAAGGVYVEMATRLVQPALYEIGRRWETNEITVSQEHAATAVCESVLAQLYAVDAPSRSRGGRAVFAAVGRNRHLLGARVVADAFALQGWETEVLPAMAQERDELLRRIDVRQPDLVGFSVALTSQLPGLVRSVCALRGEFGGRCPRIAVGGLPTNQIEGIWRRIGADLWGGDARAAETLAA